MVKSSRKLQNYVNGEWKTSLAIRYLPVENPGTGEALAQVPLSSMREVNNAVSFAHEAFREWRFVPLPDRVQYLFKMKTVLEAHIDELARIITMEHGKVMSEAVGEVKRAIENIDVAISAPMIMRAEGMNSVAHGVDVEMDYFPIGVTAIICPFNFPAMIPFWFLPHAIVTGNTCIVKASEQVPLTLTRIFELLERVGLPKGVINLIHGDKVVTDSLLEHPGLAGIASVSSTPTMRAIANKAVRWGVRFLCQGGAKNFLVVMPDADLDSAEKNILGSVYGNAGQRCLAGSNVVAVGEISPVFKRRITEAAREIKVGYGLEEENQMGPLISKTARERVLGYIERGEREGSRIILDRRSIVVPRYPGGHYVGPVVFEDVDPRSVIARDEIFGPVLIQMNANTLDEVIDLINRSPYGNAASIYTEDRRAIREFKRRVDCGNIGVNIGVPAPIAYFPFAGMKESFMGVLHGQAQDAFRFFTDIKVTTERT